MSDLDMGEPIVKKIKCNDVADDDSCKFEQEEKQLEVTKSSDENRNEEPRASPSVPDGDDDDSFEFPPDDDATEMLEGVEYHGLFPTITERYFTPYYKLNVQTQADDICILVHSNRICMLTLAPSHAALRKDREITRVNFKVSDKLDRSMNKVTGKSKHGAQPLQANSNICTITCSNDEQYTIKCCMIGKLVEVNEALLENPEMLRQPPHRGGYLAIILPNIKLLEKLKESLLTQEQYELTISQCKSITNNLKENQAVPVATKPNLDQMGNDTQLISSGGDQTALSVGS